MTECPICGKPVDPLRARAVAVRAGKVVAYCSTECQRKADEKSAAVKAVIPTTLDSGPVIEIIREPASAPVPAAAPKQDSKPVRAKTDPPVRAKTDPPVDKPKAEPVKAEPAKPEPAKPEPPSPSPSPSKSTSTTTSTSTSTPAKPESPKPEAKPEPKKRAATAPIQPPPDYDDDDLGPPATPPRRRAPLIVLLVLVVAAVGVAVAMQLMKKSHATTTAPASATGATVAPPKVEPPPPPAPPPPTPPLTRDGALGQARDLLHQLLGSESARIQRRAAQALAPTGDKAALDVLANLLAKENANEIARVDLAYDLARGGDKRGTDALVGLLGSRRDVRAEAANRLALLGDQRAVPLLVDYLDVPQLRLGAAEFLAYLAEPHAIKVLEQTRADTKATAEERARAAIALGIAGDKDVIPELEALLAVKGSNLSAAAALAGFKDDKARAVLVDQLAVVQLRVAAARALRKLDAKLDPMPLLPPLMADLASAKDTAQIEAAETILILTGPQASANK